MSLYITQSGKYVLSADSPAELDVWFAAIGVSARSARDEAEAVRILVLIDRCIALSTCNDIAGRVYGSRCRPSRQQCLWCSTTASAGQPQVQYRGSTSQCSERLHRSPRHSQGYAFRVGAVLLSSHTDPLPCSAGDALSVLTGA